MDKHKQEAQERAGNFLRPDESNLANGNAPSIMPQTMDDNCRVESWAGWV